MKRYKIIIDLIKKTKILKAYTELEAEAVARVESFPVWCNGATIYKNGEIVAVYKNGEKIN